MIYTRAAGWITDVDEWCVSSSDLITWNTLVMIKLEWMHRITRQWLEITTQSLEAWKERGDKSPFLPDNRGGYARAMPVALSKVGIPNTKVCSRDEYPLNNLGLYEDFESWEQYSGYVWSGWTSKVVQPVHIDPALQAMIDQSTQPSAAAASPPSHISTQSTSSTDAGFKGSYTSAVTTATPFPDSVEDVIMESVADKRSRESPDSTLKPEGKSLKTSGVASATVIESATFCARTTKSVSTDEVQDSDPSCSLEGEECG